MASNGFRLVSLPDFGGPAQLDANLQRIAVNLVPSGETCYGIMISAESEMDKCWIVAPYDGYAGGIAIPPGTDYGDTAKRFAPPQATFLCSVEQPIVGRMKGPIYVVPFYMYSAAEDGVVGNQANAGKAIANLSLRVYSEPTVLVPAKRASISQSWFQPSATPELVIPTFGRKLLRVFAWDPLGGSISVAYGWCGQFEPGGTGQQTYQTSFDADLPIVVPVGGGPPGTKGAIFETAALPHFMAFSVSAGAVRSCLIEVYD